MYHTFHRPVHYVAINARTIEIQNCACLLEAKISNAHFKLASPISECVKLYTHSCVNVLQTFVCNSILLIGHKFNYTVRHFLCSS